MASLQEVPSSRLLSLIIQDQQLIALVRKVSVRESICTSYISGEVIILDHNNFIDGMKIQGLDPISFRFDAPPNPKPYIFSGYVLSIQGQVSPTNVRSIIYTISFVGSEYFTDRGNVWHGATAQGETGVQMSQHVWSDCGFESALNTHGAEDSPLQDGDNPFHVPPSHPFTSISQIRDSMNYPQYPTGNCLLYRDYYTQNLVPLEKLFDEHVVMGGGTFIQKGTMGENWRDMFEQDYMVIEAKQQTRGQTSGAQDVTATLQQGIKKYCAQYGKLINNDVFGKMISIGGGMAGMVQGAMTSGQFNAFGMGGSPNIVGMNTNNRPQETDFTPKIPQERAFAALCKAGPQYNIRVPLRTGINCTVGRGADFALLPQGGEQWIIGEYAPRWMLITDLVHDCYFDMQLIRGTTTFQTMADPREAR